MGSARDFSKLVRQSIANGVVLDENGIGMAGVSIVEKGTTNGTVTDLDGNFEIRLKRDGRATLEFSYIGYKTQDIAASAGMRVQMMVEAAALEGVVVAALEIRRKTKAPHAHYVHYFS